MHAANRFVNCCCVFFFLFREYILRHVWDRLQLNFSLCFLYFPHCSPVEIGWNKMSRSLLLKLNFSFFFYTFSCAPHPAESSLIFITIQMEKSYNVPRLTMHCRLVNFIYSGSICSFGRTENTIKAKLTIIQTNKNMEPKEQALHRCNFFWDSDSSKEKAEKVSFSTLWDINSHVCSCNVCHKEVFPPPACGVNVL